LVLVAVLAIVALGTFTLLFARMGHGGAVYWWDDLRVGLRELIRGIWSTIAGQPETRDLFPF
jgi:hypothetical protein